MASSIPPQALGEQQGLCLERAGLDDQRELDVGPLRCAGARHGAEANNRARDYTIGWVNVPPLIIAGMHRSGTSATARLLEQSGLDVGGRLLYPSLDNTLGYYEDVEFYDLNLALVAAGVGDDPRYSPDWAFADRIVPSRLEPLRPRAVELLAGRGARGRAWGFKDPRTTVLLDFYDDIVPEARYLFVYRAPWEVLASLMNTQQRLLHGRADVAVHAWMVYNAQLLEFRERHPERTVLVHVDAVAERPDAVIGLAQAQLRALAPAELDPASARDAFVGGLLKRTDATSALAELLAADHPEAMAIYDRLEAAADIAALDSAPSRGAPPVSIETTPGTLPVAAVLVGAEPDGLEQTTSVARTAGGRAPGELADAGVGQLADDLVAVLFEGRLRPEALTAAVTTLQEDPEIGAVLLAAGDAPQSPSEHDPLSGVDAGAGVVLRREAWLATAASLPCRHRRATRRGRSPSRVPRRACGRRGSRGRSSCHALRATMRTRGAVCSRRTRHLLPVGCSRRSGRPPMPSSALETPRNTPERAEAAGARRRAGTPRRGRRARPHHAPARAAPRDAVVAPRRTLVAFPGAPLRPPRRGLSAGRR